MALTKSQKQKILEGLREKIAQARVIVLVGISGLKVKDLTKLRKELREKEGGLQVVKKTLANLALKEKNLDFNKEELKEELALIFGFKDEVSPAKTAYEFSRKHENLKILGGYLENQFRGKEEMITLAKLPTKDELLGRIIGSLSSPISGLVRVLEGNIKGLITVLAKAKT